MKKQIFLFALLLGSFVIFAQQQIATLQHGDSISMYYGVRAFVDAHTAASNGDIITLSSGSFDTCRITKAIKLRGAGALPDSNNLVPTSFNSLMVGVHPNNDSLGCFEMEGIFVQYLTLLPCTSPKFVRCAFGTLTTGGYTNSNLVVNNAQFINCVIRGYYNSSHCENALFANSVVWYVQADKPTTFNNCFVRLGSYSYSSSYSYLNAYNSVIFCEPSSSYSITISNSSSSGVLAINGGTFFHNIIIASGFNYIYNSTNKRYQTIASVFENWNGRFDFGNTYTLKDSVANSFRSAYGTEVGIHGGVLPFAWTPSYMYIKKCNVANRSTADGKLSVDIEVITE